jgi:hypothetical protein
MPAKKTANAEETKKPHGRPTLYTPELADEILTRLSNGETLTSICRPDTMPSRGTVHAWKAKDAEFSKRFARAKDDGWDAIADDCLEIANTPLEGVIETSKEWGVETKREDMLGHRKLQIETRLKLLAKWDPKRYGDKIDVNATHSGEVKIVLGGNA